MRTRVFILAIIATGLVLCASLGCYRRVVSVKGPVATKYEVYEPSMPEESPPSRLSAREQKAAEKKSESNAKQSEKKWWWPF